MEVLVGWQERAQSVGYFDDEYSSSQMWKQDWEAVGGDVLAARAREAVEMIEPLRGPNRPPPPGD
jgi:hypothetical protein